MKSLQGAASWRPLAFSPAASYTCPTGVRTINYTYMVRCADGSLYTGWTNDLQRRMEAHNAGKGAKYTKSRRPVELCYFETFETKEEAMRREAAIKRLPREKKLALLKKDA